MTAHQDNNLAKFPTVASEFCIFLDSCEQLNGRAFLTQLSIQLARICEAGASLPSGELSSEDTPVEERSPAEHAEMCSQIARRLKSKLGEVDIYWFVFDPAEESEPIQATVSNDLAEIYMDLKDAVALSKTELPQSDVCWHWWFDFHLHWSRHASDALRAVLSILSTRAV